MKQPGLSFHRPAAFWLGCALIAGGVLSHGPMFMMGQHTHWQMVGMPMTTAMWVGMAIIPLGLALSAYGMLPRAPAYAGSDGAPLNFHVADGAPLNRAHWALVTVLVITLAIDVMKPATLGFVMPGMTAEYGMGTSRASLLALFALTGTAIGSVVWGRIADRFGRRSAILLSALMFIGTAICGAMPTFGWNLAMCFLMGASAGGLLPITFTLMAETVPAAHRGWLLVALDSTVPGKISGAFSQQDLEQFDACLRASDAEHILVALHHQPVPVNAPWIDRYGLEEPQRFLNYLDREPRLRCVTWGHVHHAFETERQGAAFLGAPSSVANSLPATQKFTLDLAGPACRWLELGEDGSVETGVMRSA